MGIPGLHLNHGSENVLALLRIQGQGTDYPEKKIKTNKIEAVINGANLAPIPRDRIEFRADDFDKQDSKKRWGFQNGHVERDNGF